MMKLLLAGAMTMTALGSGLAAMGEEMEPMQSTAVTVRSDEKTMPHFWSSTSFGELKCPDHAPFLEDRKYSDGLPRGVAAITSGDGVHVSSATKYYPVYGGREVGIAFATVTNWAVPSAERTVQLVAHCVSS